MEFEDFEEFDRIEKEGVISNNLGLMSSKGEGHLTPDLINSSKLGKSWKGFQVSRLEFLCDGEGRIRFFRRKIEVAELGEEKYKGIIVLAYDLERKFKRVISLREAGSKKADEVLRKTFKNFNFLYGRETLYNLGCFNSGRNS